MVRKRKAEQGSALIYLFVLCLLLSAIIAALAEKIELTRILNNRLEQELALSQVAEDLTELAVAHLLSNRDGYDAPKHLIVPQEKIEDLARGYPARVEIRDEGSCFNPNNLPVAWWKDYLRNEPQLYEQLVKWYFQTGEANGSLATPVRNNYLLTPDQLAELGVSRDGIFSSTSRLTVFGPANYYLLDGEVFVSILQRTGLQLSPLAVETIIEQFDAEREQLYTDNLDSLLSRLQLPEHPPTARLERVLTARGSINPNFVEPAYLRLLLPAEEREERREFSDLNNRQQEQPFASLDDFEYYLRNTHGVNISSERLRHLFTTRCKVLGIRVLIFNQEETEVLLTVDTILERGRAGNEDAYSPIYRRKIWEAEKEGRNE